MKSKNNYSSGFTLIELLVVVSIISILSSVVLASMSTARGKAKDASVKFLATQMRNVYEMEYLKSGSYSAMHATAAGGNISSNGYSCSDTTLPSQMYQCQVSTLAGCESVYPVATLPDANKVCDDIINKLGGYYFGITNGSKSADYAVFISYPSDNTKGFCVRSTGAVSASIADSSTCLNKSTSI